MSSSTSTSTSSSSSRSLITVPTTPLPLGTTVRVWWPMTDGTTRSFLATVLDRQAKKPRRERSVISEYRYRLGWAGDDADEPKWTRLRHLHHYVEITGPDEVQTSETKKTETRQKRKAYSGSGGSGGDSSCHGANAALDDGDSSDPNLDDGKSSLDYGADGPGSWLRWTAEEEAVVMEWPEKDYVGLAKRLGRSFKSVHSKYQALKNPKYGEKRDYSKKRKYSITFASMVGHSLLMIIDDD